MARETIIAGNWKMNLVLDQAWELIHGLKQELSGKKGLRVVVFPQAPLLPLVADWLEDSFIELGTQNTSSQLQGAYTGETSPFLSQQMGCRYGLAGHSERRELFAESDKIVASKAQTLVELGMRPIVCVGESLAEREANQHEEKIKKQVQAIYQTLPKEQHKDLIFAYEPIWAIGTGKTASAEQANEIHALIRAEIQSQSVELIAHSTPILYGGSVKPESAGELLKKSEVDGLLVGGASLKAKDFISIVQAYP